MRVSHCEEACRGPVFQFRDSARSTTSGHDDASFRRSGLTRDRANKSLDACRLLGFGLGEVPTIVDDMYCFLPRAHPQM